MASLVKQKKTYYIDPKTKEKVPKGTPNAKKVCKAGTFYYAQGVPGYPPTKRIPLRVSDKRAAEKLLADMVSRAERGYAAIPDAVAQPKSLAELLAEYKSELAHKPGRKPDSKQVELSCGRISRTIEGCRFVTANDIKQSEVEAHLASLRRPVAVPLLPTGQVWFTRSEIAALFGRHPTAITALIRRHSLASTGNARAKRFPRDTVERIRELLAAPHSEQTVSHYAVALRSFSAWLAKRSATTTDVLADLSSSRPMILAHGRGTLTEAEFAKLLDATKISKRSFRGLTGIDRHSLYLLASSSGLRAKEIAALSPSRFKLTGEHPHVELGASETKNGRAVKQPIPANAVARLREYLDGKPTDSPVWGGAWIGRASMMVRYDMAEAGLPYTVDSPDGPQHRDFHALRHYFVASLERAGIPLKTASKLARHSDVNLTAKRYGQASFDEISDAVKDVGAKSIEDQQRPSYDELATVALLYMAFVQVLFGKRS